jgi:hypothetical protein
MASDGNHHELRIKGRGSLFDAVIGLSLSGNFICIPQLNFGCALSSLNDINWNTERISAHLTETDAVTIATAIYWFDNSFN